MKQGLTLTTVLFGCELLFTGLKAVALLSKRTAIKGFVGVPCFFIESGLGLTLSTMFFMTSWFGAGSTDSVRVVGILVLIVEFICMTSEAMYVFCKVRGTIWEPTERQRGRTIAKWYVMIAGFARATFQLRGAGGLQAYGALSRGVAIFVYASYTSFALLSCILSRNEKHLRIRMLLAAIFFVLTSIAAFVFSHLPRPTSAEQLTLQQLLANENITLELFNWVDLPQANLITSFVFFRLSDLAEQPLHTSHVLAAETGIFGVAPALMVLGLVDAQAVLIVRQFMFVVFPQSVALIGPLLISFFATQGRQIWNQRK